MTNKNDNPVILAMNKDFRINPISAYCGVSLYYLCKQAGFELDIPKKEAPVARNWGLHGEVVWSQYNGWKEGTKRTPSKDEIFVILFNYNGRNHVGVILAFHGGLNFVTGEGNTSDTGVRKTGFEYFNNSVSKRKDIYMLKLGRQGIYSCKERYNPVGLYKIIKYKIKQ